VRSSPRAAAAFLLACSRCAITCSSTSYADHAVMPAMRGKVFAALVFGGMMSA
jgi:hypothetical protein